MKNQKPLFPLSFAHLTGLGAILLSIILVFINVNLAMLPLLFFSLLCIVSPFMIRFSFFLPIVSSGNTGKNAVALTFDDGPDPKITPVLLNILSKHSVKATFFVTGKNASKHPDLIREILSQGHSIGNHSFSHDPILMLRKTENLYREIKSTQDVLKEFGITPYTFRPPVGITNPRLRKVLLKLGMYCVNFSCRAFDAGNRQVKGLAKRILKQLKSDNIILLHDVIPGRNFDLNSFIHEIEQVLLGIKNKGLHVVQLSELINKQVMESNGNFNSTF